MPKRSAGILMYRQPLAGIELLLVHPGGPLWARKDWGAWSIPKGEYAEDEDPLTVAKREFEEETGARLEGDFLGLGNIVQAGRKIVTAWAVEGDFDPSDPEVERVRAGMAASQRAQGVVSGSRPRGMVLPRRRPPENPSGSERVHRQAADGNREIAARLNGRPPTSCRVAAAARSAFRRRCARRCGRRRRHARPVVRRWRRRGASARVRAVRGAPSGLQARACPDACRADRAAVGFPR